MAGQQVRCGGQAKLAFERIGQFGIVLLEELFFHAVVQALAGVFVGDGVYADDAAI